MHNLLYYFDEYFNIQLDLSFASPFQVNNKIIFILDFL